MLIPCFIRSPIKDTFHRINKTVLPEERYQHIALIFLPVQSYCEVFAEVSILQHLESDLVGAKFNTTVLLPLVKCWITSHYKTNYSP